MISFYNNRLHNYKAENSNNLYDRKTKSYVIKSVNILALQFYSTCYKYMRPKYEQKYASYDIKPQLKDMEQWHLRYDKVTLMIQGKLMRILTKSQMDLIFKNNFC